MRIAAPFSVVLFLTFFSNALADDWPQWLGPQRDSVWREDGIAQRFPKDGLKVLWRKPVSSGYSGPAVANGKVYVMDYVVSGGKPSNNPSGRVKLDGTERVLCLDAKSGELIWKYDYQQTYNISYPSGPRCTPTVAGGKVYTLGAEGRLLCLDTGDGKMLWGKDLTKEYKTETAIWGYASHPLVEGDLVYTIAGGPGSVAVAFNKDTGKEVWRALSASGQGYCPPTMITHGGVRQLLIWTPDSLNSLNPINGKVYWTVPLVPSYKMAIAAPRLAGDWLFATGMGNAEVMLKLDSDKPAVKEVWRGTPKKGISCSNCTPFLHNGTIYGVDCHSGLLMAARMKDGKRLWETAKPVSGRDRDRHATSFLVKHKDRFFLFAETGDLILAKLSPQKYEELDRFHVLEPTNSTFGRKVVWSHPAFAQRCVFARNDKEIVCVSLAAGQ